MDSRTTIPISQARKNIFTLVEDVQTPGIIYTVTEKGYPKAVIMSAEELESWNETLEVMRDFPDLAKRVRAVERDIASGAYKKYATLNDLSKKKQRAKKKNACCN